MHNFELKMIKSLKLYHLLIKIVKSPSKFYFYFFWANFALLAWFFGIGKIFRIFGRMFWYQCLVMLVNLEPILGFILKIKSISNYLHWHMVAAMCFNMGQLVKKMRKNEAELEVSVWLDLKKPYFITFFSQTTKLLKKNQVCFEIDFFLSL